MQAQYEIYRIGRDGSRVLCEDAPTYQYAELKVQRLALGKPGRYAIVDHRTGQATMMNFEEPPLPEKE